MNDPLHCSEVEERMPLYVGGDLDPEGLEAVRKHLTDCALCSERHGVVTRAREAFVAALQASSSPPSGTAEGSLWTGVRAVLMQEGRFVEPPTAELLGKEPAPPLSFYRYATRFSLPLAAAAGLLLLFGWMERSGPGAAGGEESVDTIQGPLVATDDVRLGTGSQGAMPVVFMPPAGSLRRLAPGETTLSESAEVVPLRAPTPGIATPNSLAGYR